MLLDTCIKLQNTQEFCLHTVFDSNDAFDWHWSKFEKSWWWRQWSDIHQAQRISEVSPYGAGKCVMSWGSVYNFINNCGVDFGSSLPIQVLEKSLMGRHVLYHLLSDTGWKPIESYPIYSFSGTGNHIACRNNWQINYARSEYVNHVSFCQI